MKATEGPSPRIERISWGRVQVDGLGSFKDAKLWPGGGRSWDWNETGTAHQPGIQTADVEELLEHGIEVIVLGLGMLGSLGIRLETKELLAQRGIEVRVGRTEEAVEIYNRLAGIRRVGGLFHSTC